MWQRLWWRYYLLKSFPKKISFESDGLKKACTNNSVNASPWAADLEHIKDFWRSSNLEGPDSVTFFT